MFTWLDVEKTATDPQRPHLVRQWCTEHGQIAVTLRDPELQRLARLSHEASIQHDADPFDAPEFIVAAD